MSVKSVAFINSMIDNSRSLANERQNLRRANANRAERNELFKLKKTNYENKIKEQELTGLITAQKAEGDRKRIKDFSKLVTAQNDVEQGQADEASDNLMVKNKNYNSFVTAVLTQSQSGATLKQTYTPNKQKSIKIGEVDKIIGDLDNSGITNDQGFSEFIDRDAAEKYANSNLGIEWEQKYPKANDAISKNFGPTVKSFPKSIKTKREGLKYLINDIGMDEELARIWIEENN